MKHYALSLFAVAVLSGCGSSPCSDEKVLAKYAQDEMNKMFPVPASVSYTLDSVYHVNGNEVVRGRVTYTNALGQGQGPAKYWIGVKCNDGDPTIQFLDVDNGGPKWKANP